MNFRTKYKLNANIKFPRLIKLEEKNHEIILEREYLNGKNLSTFSIERQMDVLQICLNSLEEISAKVKGSFWLPKRTILFQILTLPVYLALAISKEPKMYKILLSLFSRYYFERLRNCNNKIFVIAHRDLHENNILVYEKDGKELIAMIDPEIAAFCEQQTDLAIIARYYIKNIGFKNLYKLLSSRLKTKEDVGSFVCNSIFYSLQCMAVESRSDKFYKDSKAYCKTLLYYLPKINNILSKKNLQRAGFWSTIFNTKFFQST